VAVVRYVDELGNAMSLSKSSKWEVFFRYLWIQWREIRVLSKADVSSFSRQVEIIAGKKNSKPT